MLPSKSVTVNNYKVLRLQLADPDFGTPRKIDLILGADVYTEMTVYSRVLLALQSLKTRYIRLVQSVVVTHLLNSGKSKKFRLSHCLHPRTNVVKIMS